MLYRKGGQWKVKKGDCGGSVYREGNAKERSKTALGGESNPYRFHKKKSQNGPAQR